MKSESEFKSFYDSALLPALNKLEADRGKIVRGMAPFLILFVLFLAGAIVGFITASNLATAPDSGEAEGAQFFMSISMGSVGGMIFTGILYALFYFFKFSKNITTLKTQFKNEVIGKMVTFADPSLTYEANRGMSQGDYRQSRLFLDTVHRYQSEDMVTGKLGSTAIRFSEVHAEEKTERNDGQTKSTEWRTIFKGILFAADFNKHFTGRTVVLADTAEKLFGGFGTMLQKMNMNRDPLIKVDDVEFERAFAIYGTNAVEAHYILSPSLMQRILEFRKKSGTINLSFIESRVYIAIPVRENLFEPRIYGTLVNYNRMVKYNKYLMLATGIVEDLNLNTRIWTKE